MKKTLAKNKSKLWFVDLLILVVCFVFDFAIHFSKRKTLLSKHGNHHLQSSPILGFFHLKIPLVFFTRPRIHWFSAINSTKTLLVKYIQYTSINLNIYIYIFFLSICLHSIFYIYICTFIYSCLHKRLQGKNNPSIPVPTSSPSSHLRSRILSRPLSGPDSPIHVAGFGRMKTHWFPSFP